MNYQIKMIVEFKNENDDSMFEKIAHSFKPLFVKLTNKVYKNHRDDMNQELLYALLLVIRKFEIINYDIEKRYYDKFINKYKEELIGKTNEEKEYEYKLFCNENQFINYLNKTLNNKINDYYRNISKDMIDTISLNSYVYEDIELIDTIADKSELEYNLFEKYNFDEKEIKFLKCFLEDGRILTEAEVAKKVGITQQAVNKKKKKISEKYKVVI